MVAATVSYLAPWSARNCLFVAPADQLTTTQYDPRTVEVLDGRPHAGGLRLDRSGFELITQASAVSDFADAAELDRRYVPESLALIRQVTGAEEVVFLNWMRRDSSPRRSAALPPAPDVHVDFHDSSIARRYAEVHARSPLPAPGSYRRALYTSLWRAVSPPPQDWPLALLDYRSLAADEGVPNFLFRVPSLPSLSGAAARELPRDLAGPSLDAAGAESAASVFTFQPGHRWWYFPDMHAGEALVIKLHDTDNSVAWRAPHTSFHDCSAIGARPRESVELRTVAYFC